MDSATIADLTMSSFMTELHAFKPGNVSMRSAGHGMTATDFTASAEVSVPILCDPQLPLGERILNSVLATQARVQCNTNLGMLLLFAPILLAAAQGFSDKHHLRHRLHTVLSRLTRRDVEHVYAAIHAASPGGLGKLAQHDVQLIPDCTLLEAMQKAMLRDTIAQQYSTNFAEIFQFGHRHITFFMQRWNNIEWAAVACYMMYLSSLLDSHIKRKHGQEAAKKVRTKSVIVAEELLTATQPETCYARLQNLDHELKQEGINPGTSADLTATNILIYNLILNNKKNTMI